MKASRFYSSKASLSFKSGKLATRLMVLWIIQRSHQKFEENEEKLRILIQQNVKTSKESIFKPFVLSEPTTADSYPVTRTINA